MNELSALVGSDVGRVLVDDQVTLFLAQAPTGGSTVSAQIIIDAPFVLGRAGHVDRIDPRRKATLAPVCLLLHTAVASAQVDEDVLTVSFDDCSTITIGPNARGASWKLVGQGVPNLVAAAFVEAALRP